MKTVTFSADDFGLHPSIDEAILDLARKGVVQASSVLVTSSNLNSARVEILAKLGVSIGAHLAFTETTPLKPERFGEPWITSSGKFVEHWSDLKKILLTKKLPEDDIFQEWSAQIEKLKSLAPKIDFLDSHQNLHMLPGFARIARRLCEKFQISRLRVFSDSLDLRDPIRTAIILFGRWATPTSLALKTYGAYASCRMDEASLRKILQSAPAGNTSITIMVHPGLHGTLPEDGFYKPNYILNWKQEYELLSSPMLGELFKQQDAQLAKNPTVA